MKKEFNSLKEFIGFQKPNWDISEERAIELYDYIINNLNVSQWEINVKDYGKLSFEEFLEKDKELERQYRYIESRNLCRNVLVSLPPQIDIIRLKLEDIFKTFLNINEEKVKVVDMVEEKLGESDEFVIEIIEKNKELTEQNKKLKKILEISENSYVEYWKIIEIKMDNLFDKYKQISKMTNIDEFKSYLEALKVEFIVGIKPIQEKLKYIKKLQISELGFNSDQFIDEEIKIENNVKIEKKNKKDKLKEDSKKFENKIRNIKDKEITNIKETLNDNKNNDDETDEEIEKLKIEKYTNFSIFEENMYDEDNFDSNSNYGEEEKELRKKLIKNKKDDELYILEKEVNYNDLTYHNKLRIITLVSCDNDKFHTHFGLNSVKWKNKFISGYKFNYKKLKEVDFDWSKMNLTSSQEDALKQLITK